MQYANYFFFTRFETTNYLDFLHFPLFAQGALGDINAGKFQH